MDPHRILLLIYLKKKEILLLFRIGTVNIKIEVLLQ